MVSPLRYLPTMFGIKRKRQNLPTICKPFFRGIYYLLNDMETLSQKKANVIFAHNKGYYVDKDGNVFFNGKQRKLQKSWGGKKQRPYYSFCIRNEEKKPKNIQVHQLQAYQKFGDKMFEDGIVVRHLNDDSLDNSYDNIEIGTMSDNMFDMPIEKRKSLAKHATSYLIQYDAEKVKEFYYECHSYKMTMEQFGIKSRSTLHNIIHNR